MWSGSLELECAYFPLSKMKNRFRYFREQYQSKLHPEVHSKQYFPHTLPDTFMPCLLMRRQLCGLSWEMLPSRLHYNAKYTLTPKDVIPPLNTYNVGLLVCCSLGFYWGRGWKERRNSRKWFCVFLQNIKTQILLFCLFATVMPPPTKAKQKSRKQ